MYLLSETLNFQKDSSTPNFLRQQAERTTATHFILLKNRYRHQGRSTDHQSRTLLILSLVYTKAASVWLCLLANRAIVSADSVSVHKSTTKIFTSGLIGK